MLTLPTDNTNIASFEATNNRTSSSVFTSMLYESLEFREKYKDVFKQAGGAFTANYTNKTSGKFDTALATLPLIEEQKLKLTSFYEAFIIVEKQVDPLRLDFSIAVAQDGELCITRATTEGVSTIIIDSEGLVAFSHISRKPNGKDELNFHNDEDINYEILAYNFLSL